MARLLLFVHLLCSLSSLALAQAPCVPIETLEPRIVLAWEAPSVVPDGYTLTAYRLQRTGDAPALLPPLAPDAVTTTDRVEPGTHAWQMRAEYIRIEDQATFLSDLAPFGTPPPCVVVLAALPPAPTLTGVSVASTITGQSGMHVRWTVAGPDRPVRVERQTPGGPWVHAGSAPGGFLFDLFALEAGRTYCYRACLLNADTPQCSAAQCAVYPTVP